jgi:hypothetical protein
MASSKEFSSAAGSTAGFAAVVVVIVHTFFPSGQEAGGGREPVSEKAGSGQAHEKNSAEPSQLEGPWLATRAFFNAPPSDSAPIVYDTIKPLLSAHSLKCDDWMAWRTRLGIGSDRSLHSWAIVATVADPVHSRMQLFFDAQIQSIEKAVAIHKWEFATQWLPWRDHSASSGGIEEQLRERQLEREQEALPGILVFRRNASRPDIFSSDALFVLLVPETPTKGIAGDAFYTALHLARLLSSGKCEGTNASREIHAAGDEPRKTGLLAPSFSGSFDSLTRFLWAWQEQETIHKVVYGGSISIADNAKQFEEKFLEPNKLQETTRFNFRSGIVALDSYVNAFEQVLSTYGIDHDKAAYWVEDESGFGASFQGQHDIPTYRFPREISHLRSAYQEATQMSRTSVRGAAPTLDFSLKDPSHGEDSIPVFSETHTPVGQSAAISTITEEFSREGTQMVFILASNTLDSLLLARFVRTESPNTRVLIGDADTLFIPAASQESLSGTLFLSTYPMFILGQEWLTRTAEGKHGETGKHLIFPSASHQGLFNVTQLLLAGIHANQSPGDGDCLYGYRPLALPSRDQKDTEPLHLHPADMEHPGLWLLTLNNYGFLPLDWFPVNPREGWFDPESGSQCTPTEAKSTSMEERFPLDPPSLGWYISALGMSVAIILACIWRLDTGDSFASGKEFLALLGVGLSLTAAQWILLLPAWRVLAGVGAEKRSFLNWITLAVAATALIAPFFTQYIVLRRGRKPLKERPEERLPFWAFFWDRLSEERPEERPERTPGRTPGADGKKRAPHRTHIYAIIMFTVFLWISSQWAWANGGIWSATSQRALLFRMRAVQLFSDSSPALPLFLLSLVFCFGFAVYFVRYTEATTKGTMGRPDPGLDEASIVATDKWITAPFGLSTAEFRWRLGICISLVAVAMSIISRGMFAFEPAQFNDALYIAVSVVLFSLATACYDLVKIWHHLRAFVNRLEWGGNEAFERVTKDWPRRRVIWLWQSVPEDFFTAQLASAAPWDVFALHTCRYLVYVVRQIQRIAWSIGLALVMLIAVLTAYSAQSPQLDGRLLAVLFLIIGGIVVWVFASMEKNWILSRIDRTEPGKLNFEFWMQATAVVAVPLIGVLVHLFPSIGSFASSWLAPSLGALR